MSDNLKGDEKKLFLSTSPSQYIEKSLKAKIPSGRKAFITRLWLENTGFTIKEIEYERNRHPYWKNKKGLGQTERLEKGFKEHNYSNGRKIVWSDEMLSELINLNKKDKNNSYLKKDWELAQHFKCSIPTIQHQRRKINMATKIILKEFDKTTSKKILKYIKMGESSLRNEVKKNS